MFHLDPLTLATYSAGMGSLFAVLAAVYWHTRRTHPGFGHWAISVWFIALAMVFVSLRGWISDSIATGLGPGLSLLCGMYIANHGTRRFFGASIPDRVQLAFLYAAFAAVAIASLFVDATAMRVAGAVGAALMALRVAWNFMTLATPLLRVPAAFCAVIFVLFALQRLVRIDFYLTPDATADMLRAVPASSFNYVINALMATFWSFGFLLLNTTRVETELDASREELRALALIDPLTGVYNRRALYDHATRELTRATRNQQSVTMLMVDIDHFKAVNDIHGHLVGDQVLCQVAAAIKGTLRASDVVARYGGEEFAVLLIDARSDTERESAERLRLAIAAVEVIAPQGPVRVTASIGLAATTGDELSVEELMRRADAALYLAKERGRDQVVAA